MKFNAELLSKIVGELHGGNDRACAVVAGSLLEFQLERLLAARVLDLPECKALFDSFQPLSTFSARIAISHAFGLIPRNVFRDLTRIRKIRNEFSHQFQTTTFESEPVRSHVNELLATKWLLEHHHLADKPIPQSDVNDIRNRPRRQFEIAVAIVSLTIDTFIQRTVRCDEPPDFLLEISGASGQQA